ncbi:glycosyltransferase family protein [Candidatus Pseudothioglobus singularis]|jgi:spore coat polysaccharide biosynthesis protein SpsF|nr:glycosyltransferase family protein [Candidatus Pseudothioglobus singularis]
MNVVAIVQARMSSSRFPGKTLANLCGSPVLLHVVERLKKCNYIHTVVVATTTNKEDDNIEAFCNKHNVECFRGSSSDVLSRYALCSKKYNANTVVRITSDNPLIDSKVVDHVIDFFLKGDFDYVANNIIKTFPHGLDVEVMSNNALQIADKESTSSRDREHVTQYIRSSDKFKIQNIESDIDYSDIRITLDEDEDYKLIQHLVSNYGKDIEFSDIVNIFINNPSLKKTNSKSKKRHAIYNKKSLIV